MAEEKLNIKKLARGKKSIYMLDPKNIYIDPEWNERNMNNPKVQQHIEDLAYSFSKIGMKDPVTIVTRDNKAALTDGYCRMAAIPIAAEKYDTVISLVQVRIEERGTNEADHIAGMITRNSGLGLNFAEQACVVKRLYALGLDKKAVADKIGKSLTHVDNCLLLLEADQSILNHVKDGDVSARFAVDTIKKKGDKALSVIAKTIATAKATGTKTATKRHAPKAAPKIQWGTHGPEFMSLLEALVRSHEGVVPKPSRLVGDVINAYNDYKLDHNLVAERTEA